MLMAHSALYLVASLIFLWLPNLPQVAGAPVLPVLGMVQGCHGSLAGLSFSREQMEILDGTPAADVFVAAHKVCADDIAD